MDKFISKIINKVMFFILYIKNKLLKKQIYSDGILIVRFAHLGDFIVWLDSAQAYRMLYPDKNITFLCYEYKNVKQLAEATNYFDKVIIVNTKGFNRIKSLIRIMSLNFDIIINANPSRTILSDLYVMAPKANKRIAPSTDFTCITKLEKHISDKVYNKVIFCDGIKTMELIRNAQFIRGLGIEDFKASIPKIPTCGANILAGEQYIVFCIGAETPYKYWPYEKYKKVIDYILINTKSYKCVLLGTESEGIRFNDYNNKEERVICLFGKTTLMQYISLIRNAKLVISNDTSGAHIAAASNVPCIVFGVGWDKGRFFPYKVEKESENLCLPITLTAEVDCLGCEMKDFKNGNIPMCISDSGTVKCVEQVSCEQVYSVINEIFSLTK